MKLCLISCSEGMFWYAKSGSSRMYVLFSCSLLLIRFLPGMTKLGAKHDAMSNLIGCSVRIADSHENY